ncbi:MAG: SpoIID/LytB domain-containing protein, partial [Thermoleophilia bacterium]
AAAAPEVSFTFYGRGFGHGVGMSQYGARGAAQQGWSAARILAFYYPGTTLGQGPGGNVRVLLAAARPAPAVAVDGDGWVATTANNAGPRVPLTPGAAYTAAAGPGGVTVAAADGTVVATGASLRVVAGPTGMVRLGTKQYRGELDLLPDGGGVDVVNAVAVESYLRGVVPLEMPASWGDTPAALQAQAVAARSYTATSLRPGAGFDLYPDTRSQMYGGVAAETASTDAAVAATAGRVSTYNGQVIHAYYMSTDGGSTENVENSLGGSPVPYLVAVRDPFDAVSPVHLWPDPPVFTATKLGSTLGLAGPVASVQVLKRGASPRVLLARFTTADGTTTDLTGATIRARLGLRDTWFWVGRSDQPVPTEPPLAGNVTPAPTTPVSAHTPAPATQRPRVGDFLVVASRQPTRRFAQSVRRQLLAVRPHAVVVDRRHGRHHVFLVVTARTRTRPPALHERDALRHIGYAATLTRALRGEPAVTSPGTTGTTTVAALRYRVVAADRGRLAVARADARMLLRHGRRPHILHTVRAHHRHYLVVSVTGVTLARARAEVRALHGLGVSARVRRVASP